MQRGRDLYRKRPREADADIHVDGDKPDDREARGIRKGRDLYRRRGNK